MMSSAGPAFPPSLVQRHFRALAKPAGATCNLDCKYCFFLSRELLYPGHRMRMADDLLETYIRQLLESQRGPDVTLAWHGGEPTLMGLEFFRRSIEHVAKHQRPGTRVAHTIETNGVDLDDDWCEFFHSHNFVVSVTLDGPPEMHDAYRVDRDGQPTFERVMHAIGLLQKHGVDLSIVTTVHDANADHPLEVYRFLRDEVQARYIHVIPVVERVTEFLLPLVKDGWGDHGDDTRPLHLGKGDLVTHRSVTAEQWGNFLIQMFDEWLAHDVGTTSVRMFDAAIASWIGAPSPMCIFAETCGDAVSVEHNGDVYSCDHFVGPGHLLGNICKTHLLQIVSSDAQKQFGAIKRDTLPQYCRDCAVRFACHGECPKNRFITTPDGEPGLNYLCAGYKAFFTHIDRPMRLIVDLLRRGQYADDAMAMLTSGRYPFDDRLPVRRRSAGIGSR
jgi:uncharacterized protein